MSRQESQRQSNGQGSKPTDSKVAPKTGKAAVRTFKIDLHTHSTASPDGGIKPAEYARMLDGGLDYIAVTDHGTAAHALKLQTELGDRIIVGQEVMTTAGEIIGLYIKQTIPDRLSPELAAAAIHEQGGLVYVPHPFETTRHGLQADSLARIAAQIDIMEAYNGRAMFQNKSPQAHRWATEYSCVMAASSDSHSAAGWGKTYSVIAAQPSRDNLASLLAKADYVTGFPGIRAVIAPKMNRLQAAFAQRKRRLGGSSNG